MLRSATDEERLHRASSVSSENDNSRRAASLTPRKILAEHRCLVWWLISKLKKLMPRAVSSKDTTILHMSMM